MECKIGTDIGGTCTDTVVSVEGGGTHVGKALTTYPDFSEGIFDSLADAADGIGVSLAELIESTTLFIHSTSVGENTIFERDGAETGLLTTAGFEDTLHETRGGYGRWSGLSFERTKDIVKSDKPEPLVPDARIKGVAERSFRNESVIDVNREDVCGAVEELADEELDSLAVCFIWSTMNAAHEEKVGTILADEFPELDVSLSSEVSSTPGEYERTSTTVLNSYLSPSVRTYITNLRDELVERGLDGRFLIMFSHGGVVTPQHAIDKPIGLIESGPVGGVIGSEFVGTELGSRNVISVDMGGTTFKVGVVSDGEIETASNPMVGRHHYQFPKKDVHSIPIAGGSIVSLDEKGIPSVGPESAGSDPGPVCYGQGGERTTVTDVDLIKGYFSPDHFLGGDHDMEPEAARDAFRTQIAEPLNMDVDTAAAEIYELTNSMIVDFIRETTVEKGIDPREFLLSSIGGAAGMHAASIARKLDIPKVMIPATASVHSALGLLSTNLTYERSQTQELTTPFDPSDIAKGFSPLVTDVRELLLEDDFDESEITIQTEISMRYARQVHEIRTPIEYEDAPTESDIEETIDRFEERYEQRYGAGSKYKKEGIELTGFHVRGIGHLPDPELGIDTTVETQDARIDTKEIHFAAADGRTETPIYDFTALPVEKQLHGPAVIVTPVTTIVVNPGDVAELDSHRNLTIDIEGAA